MHTISEVATFGGGCFWCLEAIFQEVVGVNTVTPGYSGGHVPEPTYDEVCHGTTGHAEVVNIEFDPSVISYLDLLEIFWQIHDPTTLNRQGNDIGTQYRSVIYYHNPQQKIIAKNSRDNTNSKNVYADPIVTEISSFEILYAAENYHHNYFINNKNQPYCHMIIAPKLKKFRKNFSQIQRNNL